MAGLPPCMDTCTKWLWSRTPPGCYKKPQPAGALLQGGRTSGTSATTTGPEASGPPWWMCAIVTFSAPGRETGGQTIMVRGNNLVGPWPGSAPPGGSRQPTLDAQRERVGIRAVGPHDKVRIGGDIQEGRHLRPPRSSVGQPGHGPPAGAPAQPAPWGYQNQPARECSDQWQPTCFSALSPALRVGRAAGADVTTGVVAACNQAGHEECGS